MGLDSRVRRYSNLGGRRALLIDVAETLATAIGALADDAIGGAVFGDSARWWHGPFFDDASVTDGQESPERQ